MLIDARSLDSGMTVRSHVCIIGGGAAGLTLARQLSRGGRTVCLLEGGGLDPDRGSADLYAGTSTGQPCGSLDVIRLRYFGGTTNHWAGYCRVLDPNDFETRPWVPRSGWPFDRDVLDAYYLQAADICDLMTGTFRAEAWAELTGHDLLPFERRQVLHRVTRFSLPTRFGQKFRAELEDSPSTTVYLHANLTRLEPAESGGHVVRAHAETLSGVRLTVEADRYVLACGGIENPRQLLLSGLGNDRDLVGRYFMEHTNIRTARLLLRPETVALTPFYQVQMADGRRTVQGGLGLSPDAQRRNQVGNVSAWLEPYSPGENPGVRALRETIAAFGAREMPDNLQRHIYAIMANADQVTRAVFQEMFKETPFQIRTVSEQAPNPDSRVTLGEDVDALGLRRVRLHWQLTEFDKRSILTTVRVLAEEMGRLGMGRVRVELSEDEGTWPNPTWWGHHHMGTTRMHSDPSQGVVDADCRVHGMTNLFVAGSSVFPTSGSAGPTLTIVALALRLADHLEREAAR
jgi:choline dehydrogenase-like flavoprotein